MTTEELTEVRRQLRWLKRYATGATIVFAAIVLVALQPAPAFGQHALPIPTGDWTGDIAFPSGLNVAWGVTWHVSRSDSATSGLALSMTLPTARNVGPVLLTVDGDALRFPLPFRRGTSCEATARDDGSWRGGCEGPDASASYRVALVPPGHDRPAGLARMGLERVEGDWRETADGPVRVYTRPGTEAHRHLDAVVRHARAALEHAVELLDADGWEGPLRLVYLESPAEMEQAFDRAVRGGSADAGANAALLVTYEGGATGVVHEVLHVVSMRQWGAAAQPGMWLQEGVAEWGEGADCGDVPHGRLDRHLHDRGDGLPVSVLTANFRQHSDVVTMPQATTLVTYLVETHGMETVRELWDRGIGEAETVLGYGIDTLQRRWRAWVEERYVPATEDQFEATIGSATGCPREEPPGG